MIYFRLLLLYCLFSFACASSIFGQEATTSCCVRITLLQLNDVSQFTSVDRGARGSLARVSTLRRNIARESPNLLFVLAGNTISPSVESLTYRGQQMVDAWNAAGLDYAAFGNHEFDFGPDVLRERVRESRFTWLAANVIDKKTGKPFADTPPYVIREFEGVKIGLFGLLTPQTAVLSLPGADLEFQQPSAAAKSAIRELRRLGARVIVAITHQSLEEDQALARQVSGIDLIIGGHTRTIIQSLSGNTPIIKMSADARDLGRIQLNVDASSGQLESIDTDIIPVTSIVPDDPQFASVSEKYGKMMTELSSLVGHTLVALDARAETNGSRETNIGSFIADTFRQELSADVALVNSSSIGADTIINPGELTRRDVLALLPFRYQLVKLRVGGSVLLQALEHGVSSNSEVAMSGRFPQVSGLRFTFDASRRPGSRIVEVMVGNQPLEAKKLYTLATNAFMMAGGDGYRMLSPKTIVTAPKITDSDALLKAITAARRIAPQTDGRILRLSGTPKS